jgi:chromate transporter
VTMVGILIPSSTLALAAMRWSQARRDSRGVRAMVAGLAPLTVGLLLATGWVLAAPLQGAPGAIVLVIASAFVMWRWRPNPLWLICAGALVGALGGA